MNIGGLFRSLAGEVKAGDVKSLELKPGQVVRGVVQQLIANNEAILSVNGHQIRARLEASLAEGQAAMLQVQPETAEGRIVLKTFNASPQPLTDASMSNTLKSAGLADTAENRAFLLQLQQSDIPLTKQNVRALADFMSALPSNTAKEQWLQAGILAWKKELPLTQETAAALRQTVQGPPLHELIAKLEEAVLRELAGHPKLTAESRQLLDSLRSLLQQIRLSSSMLLGENGAGAPAARGAASGVPAPPPGAVAPAAGSAAPSVAAPPPGAVAPAAGGAEPGASAPPPGALASPPSHWISGMLKALGVDHESQIMKMLGESAPTGASPAWGQAPNAADAASLKWSDTVKSALMQMMGSNELSASLKETAQQVLQHITGQQLLLSADRSALLSHITLFVPLHGENGQQTAAIHIQSRKGKNGALDPLNCRLVFDLHMKSLGDTMVDVQVVDRIVSLQIHNDTPFLRELVEQSREELETGLAAVGYPFISVKYSPYPRKAAESGREQSAFAGATPAPNLSAGSFYSGMKTYKGVDFRV